LFITPTSPTDIYTLSLHDALPILRAKLARSLGCVLVMGIVLGLATQISVALDVTEDQRNSFPAADQRALAQMTEPLVVTVHLARSEEHTSELQSRGHLVCRLLLEK